MSDHLLRLHLHFTVQSQISIHVHFKGLLYY